MELDTGKKHKAFRVKNTLNKRAANVSALTTDQQINDARYRSSINAPHDDGPTATKHRMSSSAREAKNNSSHSQKNYERLYKQIIQHFTQNVATRASHTNTMEVPHTALHNSSCYNLLLAESFSINGAPQYPPSSRESEPSCLLVQYFFYSCKSLQKLLQKFLAKHNAIQRIPNRSISPIFIVQLWSKTTPTIYTTKLYILQI